MPAAINPLYHPTGHPTHHPNSSPASSPSRHPPTSPPIPAPRLRRPGCRLSSADKPMLPASPSPPSAPEAESFHLPSPSPHPPSTLVAGGHPLHDLYDHRRRYLGNQGPPDGARFPRPAAASSSSPAVLTTPSSPRKSNFQPLVANPGLAASPAIATQLLACFLAHKQAPIRRALAANDLAAARRLVNGGSNGLDRFIAAYTAGAHLLT